MPLSTQYLCILLRLYDAGDNNKPRQCAAYRDFMRVGDSLWGLTESVY